ncbi:MAG: TlpA family protein disulfide reductase [Bacteroidales bacterium]|nr:TlpA family protein disulfide reductase [Bacteroidales bacterium]
MKKLLFALGALLLLSCGGKNTATITGTLCDYQGKGCFMLIDNERNYDTIAVDANGNFCHKIECTQAENGGLYLEYLGDNRTVIEIYITPGANINVNLDGEMKEEVLFGEKMTRYIVTPNFTGDNVKECEYLNLPKYPDFHYVNGDGTLVVYADFKKQVKEWQSFFIDKLEGCSDEFKAEAMEIINAIPQQYRFIFARIAHREGNYNCSKDPDFVAEVSKINLNDTSAISDITNYVWYDLNIANPQLYEGKPYIVREMLYLNEKIENGKVKESIADYTVDNYMVMGENEGLVEAFDIYRKVSGSSALFHENEKTYNNLARLLPGVKATDFTMQDPDGNSVQFLDVIGKGKITYIDFWATWCGPCCMEIPYVEKLVEHYKNNDKIEMLSISLDENRDKWLEKLAKDKPAWRQYIIPEAFGSEFAKEYNIRAIPRFMIFDAEGKIITINADRPSSENIVKYLDSIIAGK